MIFSIFHEIQRPLEGSLKTYDEEKLSAVCKTSRSTGSIRNYYLFSATHVLSSGSCPCEISVHAVPVFSGFLTPPQTKQVGGLAMLNPDPYE